jgi:UrcA family protein
MTNISQLITAIALAASTATLAQAQDSVAVKTSDLNLSSAKGQKQLAARIDRAATTLCSAEAISQSPQMIRNERRCKEAAKRLAAQQIAARIGTRTAVD